MSFLQSRWRWLTGIAVAAVIVIVAVSLVAQPEDEAWARIQERKVITFATDPTFTPFEALDAKGDFFGFDIDLARAIAARLGLKADFEAVAYDGLIGTLVVGRDEAVISAWTLQPERGQEASFTPSYFNAGVMLVTRADTNMDGGPQDWAAGKTLAAEFGSQGDALIRKWTRLVAGLTPLSLPDSAAAMQAVMDGNAEGALVDAVAALEFLKGRPQLKIAAPIVEADAPYVIAVSAKSSTLLRELTRVLNDMEADGSLGELRVKWFGEAAR